MTYNPLVLKLRHFANIHEADERALKFGHARHVELGGDIVPPDTHVTHTSLLLAGVACRYKMMAGGRRAIVGFLLPGDFTNFIFSERQMVEFGVAAITACEVVDVPCSAIRQLAAENERLSSALWATAQMDQAVQRTWLANIGQCGADKRMAHLLCELRQRFAIVELADENRFPLSLTQQDLADALGLSNVHVNRTLQLLKARNLLHIANRVVIIPDLGRLENFADFDPGYLLGHGDRLANSRPAMPAGHDSIQELRAS